ncbi:uncharacterized protein LOC122266772 [Penaeus japonicus]|uniref:uncharacterized protein LOC122250000 n=1 Tax=Penaeus japonicus TaxID=27405 RepID=UPI001C7157B9|nr:uncharacterized protein LOC122250000 [Penaeus japonicus]XP_042892579.1 uncharacterized protein LOC122266772 [Penaeus japonicus]
MKFVVCLTVLVAAVCAQRQTPRDDLEEACGDLPRRECLSRVRRCRSIRRASEDAPSNKETIMTCAEENNIRPIDIVAAIRASGGREEIFDKLEASQETIDNMRLCVLRSKDLLDQNGNIDGERISAQIEEKLRINLEGSPDVLDVMLNALATCALPVAVSDVPVFRNCLSTNCIQNYPSQN